MFLTIWEFGPFWACVDSFGPFQTKNDFFAQKHLRKTLFCPYGAFYGDIILCHRYRQQKVPNTFLTLWTTLKLGIPLDSTFWNSSNLVISEFQEDLLLAPSHIWRVIVLSFHVASKMAGSFAGVAALTTFVWFFPSMSALVCFQMMGSSGSVVALITLERPLSWMDPHVVLQVTNFCASEDTLRATERLLSRMCQHV